MDNIGRRWWRVERRTTSIPVDSDIQKKLSLARTDTSSQCGDDDDANDAETPGAYAITSRLGERRNTSRRGSGFMRSSRLLQSQDRRVLPVQEAMGREDNASPSLEQHNMSARTDVFERPLTGIPAVEGNVDSLDHAILFGKKKRAPLSKRMACFIIGATILVSAIVFGGIVAAVMMSSRTALETSDSSSSSNTEDCDIAVPREIMLNPLYQCRCSGRITEVSDAVEQGYKFIKRLHPFDQHFETKEANIEDCDDPVNLALLWTAMDMSDGGVLEVAQKHIDRFALSLVYSSMGGTSWRKQTHWLSNKSVCSWHGVECGRDNHVQSLNLTNNNLNGYLETGLGHLVALEELFFEFNAIAGKIPTAIWSMPKLEDIRLHYNHLTGSIPSHLGLLVPNLRKLIMYQNFITGSIPDLQGLSNLTELSLGDSFISGTFPKTSLEDLHKLDTLDLKKVALQGDISEWLPSLSNLRWLALSETEISGFIPESIGSLSKLAYLELGSRDLTGSLPSTLGLLTKLTGLSVVESNLEGTLPSEVGQCSQLKILHIGSPLLSGTIPSSLMRCSNLENIHFVENSLTGNLPSEILELSHLKELSISCSSQLETASIPTELCSRSTTIFTDRWQHIPGCSCCRATRRSSCRLIHEG